MSHVAILCTCTHTGYRYRFEHGKLGENHEKNRVKGEGEMVHYLTSVTALFSSSGGYGAQCNTHCH